MIISASRRTDIPAFYSDWFIKRMQEGFVLVRNPMNPHQVSSVSLKREDVDCIVFWTKNPEDMLPKLDRLDGYPFYFQFTLNPYGQELEPGVPRKAQVIDIFKRLSDRIGKERVIWRYDPIILNNTMDISWHEQYFDVLAGSLFGYTTKCIISFVDYYRKLDKTFKAIGIAELYDNQKQELAAGFSAMARKYGLKLETCAEEIDLSDMGIGHARCIDPELIQKLTGVKLKDEKDNNQRKLCGCAPSVDIGMYDTCRHGCIYCYANHSKASAKRNAAAGNVDSPLLCSELTEEDRLTERKSSMNRNMLEASR